MQYLNNVYVVLLFMLPELSVCELVLIQTNHLSIFNIFMSVVTSEWCVKVDDSNTKFDVLETDIFL